MIRLRKGYAESKRTLPCPDNRQEKEAVMIGEPAKAGGQRILWLFPSFLAVENPTVTLNHSRLLRLSYLVHLDTPIRRRPGGSQLSIEFFISQQTPFQALNRKSNAKQALKKREGSTFYNRILPIKCGTNTRHIQEQNAGAMHQLMQFRDKLTRLEKRFRVGESADQ